MLARRASHPSLSKETVGLDRTKVEFVLDRIAILST
jgi:hypothetical protein